ncbi:MAG: sugar transferase [Candidatus Electrothrix aestuarii]|uniref:Sugar transferase n=1 Tax=Candidatus Electrothrix aestuarii TaxID=3062594 RepID=A0AAU8LUE2_9BACT|nr:sugar transferase [Candidatus Electrothrix aestuarii]
MSPALSWNLRQRSSVIYKLLLILDCSLVCGYLWFLVLSYKVPWSRYYTWLELVAFSLSFICFQYLQLYRSWRGWKLYLEFFVISKAWASVVGFLLFYFFIFKVSEGYSRVVFILWALTTPFLIFFSHLLVRQLLRYYRSKGKNIRHAVIVGAGDLGLKMAQQMEVIPWAGIEIIGFFDDKLEANASKVTNKPLLGEIEEIQEYLLHNDIDYVYIALPMRAERKIFWILRECRDLGAQIFLVPDLYIFGLHHAEIQSVGDMLVLNFNPASSWKRGFDIIFSLTVLLLSSPLMLLVMLLIKLDSKGPVFYRHRRITATGREFGCLKFRTMVIDADQKLNELLESDPALAREWKRNFKLKKDPRITRIGRFLRRTSLDEFPQFFNVLKGEMSVVGARPIIGRELEEYYKGNGEQSAGRYVSMKPGITGPWQVTSRSDVENYKERIELDDWYVLNYSLIFDIKIILKTIRCMLTGKGAY